MGRKSLNTERKKSIIKAFYDVAKREGLENASIAKVAKEIDVNPSLVIHYFKTKRDLLDGLIEFILQQYIGIYNPNGGTLDLKARLVKIIENLFSRKWDKLIDDGVFYSSFSLIFRDKKLRHQYKNMHDRLRGIFADTLSEAKQKGIIKVDSVEKTADIIFVLVEGAYYCLSMVSNKVEYNKRMLLYRQTALQILGLA